MAYVKKYEATFYNRFQTAVTVELYKEGADAGSSEIKVQSLEISTNYQGDQTPVIGTGCNLVIVNEGTFYDYDELLTNYEKEWKIVVYYDAVIVFEGFLVCDLNEQKILIPTEITLQFTNYLRRLEDTYLTALNDIGSRVTLQAILVGARTETELIYDFYVNSSLFETNMFETEDDCFLDQTLVESDVFYINPDEYEDAYTVLNKILLPFNAFLYMYGQKWIIERYDDIGRTGLWTEYSGGAFTSTPNLKQTINKQDGDFKYVEMSQALQYNSGAKTLKINLNEKKLESFVYNNFELPFAEVVGNFQYPTTLANYHTWYMNSLMEYVAVYYNYKNQIAKYIAFRPPSAGTNDGFYYKFVMSFNPLTADPFVETELTISFKTIIYNPDSYNVINARIALTVQVNGLYYFLQEVEESDGIWVDNAPSPTPLDIPIYMTGLQHGDVVEVTKTLFLDHFWDEFGNPDMMDVCLHFLPFYHDYKSISDSYGGGYIGDVSVTVNDAPIDNEITNLINENFIKKEEIDLDLFDLSSLNYSNGLFVDLTDSSGAVNDGMVRTSLWTSEEVSTPASLVDILVKSKMKKLAQTTRKLIARISCDLHLKPFTVITDDEVGYAVPLSSYPLLDLDGNEYTEVTIGNLVFTVENLKVTKYADGTTIPLVTDNALWVADTVGARCTYNNDVGNLTTYGALYSGNAVKNVKGIAKLTRNGVDQLYRVPTKIDFEAAMATLGGTGVAGGKMKETGLTRWNIPNTGATNESGFTAVGGGIRENSLGVFLALKDEGRLWTSTAYDSSNTYIGILWYNNDNFVVATSNSNIIGASIRLVRDVTDTPSPVILPMNFILNQYKWDLVNGIYDIEAEEYTDTDITITTDPIP